MKKLNIINEISKEKAIELYKSYWWEGKSHREIAEFQLFTNLCCVPWEIFHEAIEKSLGRPVYTHEFGLDYNGLCKEFLGERAAPTTEEIINLIPEEKRVVIFT